MLLPDLSPVFDIFDKEFLGMVPAMPRDFNPSLRLMRTDITKNDTEYAVEIDLPGFSKEDITIEIKDNVVEVCAKRDDSKKEEGKNYVRRERIKSSCSRKVSIPDDVDVDAIKAKLENGVLNLTLPRVTPEEPEEVLKKTVTVE